MLRIGGNMELLDTRKKSDNLTGTLIADLVLQIFAYVAQQSGSLFVSGRRKALRQQKQKERCSGEGPHRFLMSLTRWRGNIWAEKSPFEKPLRYWA